MSGPAPALPSNRSFGATIAVIFALIGLYPMLGDAPVRQWALITAGGLALVAVVAPSILTVPNRLWMGFGAVAGRVTNPLVLALVFFLFITPISLLLRALRQDPLGLRLDEGADTYWHTAESPWDRESMRRQF